MPIQSSDLTYRLSGGATNTDPNASLGGAMSSAAMPASLFDAVSSQEAAAGDAEYRCVYVRNGHATLTLYGARLWIAQNTSGNRLALALGASAINAVAQTVPDENTAPSGVAFSQPADKASALLIGDLPPGGTKSIWMRRTIPAAAPGGSDTYSIRVEGDTEP